MLRFLSWPGRVLTRRADGVLPPVVALIVYLLIAAAIVLLLRHAPATPPPLPDPAAQQPVAVARAAAPAAPPAPAPALVGPGGFVPLQSQAVKDAIHRALVSGMTQRWQDGALSGYAVPSLATDAQGCRAVRYTIDQAPEAGYGSINACDASGH